MNHSNTRVVLGSVAAAAAMAIPATAMAQSRPFPTSGHYAQGFLPSAATAAAVQSSYDNWKSKYHEERLRQ
jgi:putative Ca2+/H+ antiporter (TMEM165/GDT1 family)